MYLTPEAARRTRAGAARAPDVDVADRGPIPFAMWLFRSRWTAAAPGQRGAGPQGIGAQALSPPGSTAQIVPAQQSVAVGSQRSPAAVHWPPSPEAVSVTQAAAPTAPAQAPVQQSSPVVQGAPSGAQLSWQARAPVPSTRQWPAQHWSGRAQEPPAARQPVTEMVPRQRRTPA